MIKSLALLTSTLATVTPIEPNITAIEWYNCYDLGDMEDDSFSFTYQNKDYSGNWLSTNIADGSDDYDSTLGNGQYTITTHFNYDNWHNLIFSQDYPYIPCYVGYKANDIEYTQFYLIDSNTNTFLIDTTEHYVNNDTYFVFKFPYELTIDHTFIYDSAIRFYSDICYVGDIYNNDEYLNGYNSGFHDGYDVGEIDGYNDGRYDGYYIGYQDGANSDITTNGVKTMFNTIVSYPINFLKTAFNFEIFGINLSALIMFVLSCGIILYVVNKFRK